MNFLNVTLLDPGGNTRVQRTTVSKGRDLVKAAEFLLRDGLLVRDRPPSEKWRLYPPSRILLISYEGPV